MLRESRIQEKKNNIVIISQPRCFHFACFSNLKIWIKKTQVLKVNRCGALTVPIASSDDNLSSGFVHFSVHACPCTDKNWNKRRETKRWKIIMYYPNQFLRNIIEFFSLLRKITNKTELHVTWRLIKTIIVGT